MKCPDIRKLLSGYIDGDLDEKQNSSMMEHLMICDNCTKELDLLKETVSLLKTRKTIEPPPDFVVQVRKKIEARRWWKEAFKVIFLPLHIKIPAEAIATVVIVCLLYYIYREPIPMKPQIVMKEAPVYKEELESMPSEKIVKEKQIFREAIRKRHELDRRYEKEEISFQDRIDYDTKTIRGVGQEEIGYRKSAEMSSKPRVESYLSASTSEVRTEAEESRITLGQAIERGTRPEEIELSLTLKKPKKDLLRIKKYIILLNAVVLSEGYNPETGETNIIIQINSKNYSEFTKKLIQMGLSEPKAIEVPTKGETIIVRLRLR